MRIPGRTNGRRAGRRFSPRFTALAKRWSSLALNSMYLEVGTLATNPLDPRYVEIVFGTLDELPRAWAALEQSARPRPGLDRNRTNTDLNRRIRERALHPDSVPKDSRSPSGKHPRNPSTAVISNLSLTR